MRKFSSRLPKGAGPNGYGLLDMRFVRLPIAVVALSLLLAGVVSYAATEPWSSSGDNNVVLVNRQDDRTLERAGFSTQRELGDTVDNANSAAAVSAACSDCRTVAVAVQVVLVEGTPHTVTPKNQAIALNQACTRCATMAVAFQYVVSTGGIVYFSPEGQRAMSHLRNEIATVTGSGLPFSELDARISELVNELWATVDREMRSAGRPFESRRSKDIDVDTSSEQPAPSPSPSDRTTSSPGPTMTPSSDASGSSPTCPTPSPTLDEAGASPMPGECPAPDRSGSPSSEPTATTRSDPTPDPSPTGSQESSPSPSPSDSPSP